MPNTRIVARPWIPQDLIDDLQGIIDEECDNYLNTRRTTLCMARDYLKEHFAKDNNVPSKWIPVTERLPEAYKLVLAVCKSGKIFVGEYVDLGWRTLWRIKTARDSTKEITQIVTHWMPLPPQPKGE